MARVKVFLVVFIITATFASVVQAQEASYELLWSYKTGNPVRAVSITPDGSLIAAESRGGGYLFAFPLFLKQFLEPAKASIEQEKGKGFVVTGAEVLLGWAQETFGKGKYEAAGRLALEAKERALDIDDEVPNERDFAPIVNSNHIYLGTTLFLVMVAGGTWLQVQSWLRRRKEFQRRKAEILAMIQKIIIVSKKVLLNKDASKKAASLLVDCKIYRGDKKI